MSRCPLDIDYHQGPCNLGWVAKSAGDLDPSLYEWVKCEACGGTGSVGDDPPGPQRPPSLPPNQRLGAHPPMTDEITEGYVIPKLDPGPLCPVCNQWRLTQLGPLFVCAGCECAWTDWQLVGAARAAQEDRDAK